MNRVNLLPWREHRRQRQLRLFATALAASVLFAVGAVALAAARMSAGVERQRGVNDGIATSIRALDADISEADRLRRETREIDNGVAQLRGLQAKRTVVAGILAAIAETAVPGAHYTRLAREGGSITLVGGAESHDRVSTLMRELQAAGPFETPTLRAISPAERASAYGDAATEFELSLPLAAQAESASVETRLPSMVGP